MSSVRMCDKCESIFKEGAPGSGTGTITVMVEDSRTGMTVPRQQQEDRCPPCSGYVPKEERRALRSKSKSEMSLAEAERIVRDFNADRYDAEYGG